MERVASADPKPDLARRGFLAGAAASGLVLARPRRAAAMARMLRIGFTGGRSSALGAGVIAFGRTLDQLTGGALRIDVYANSTLGGEVEMIQAVRNGEIDLAFISSVAITGMAPEYGVFDIPFLFRDAAHGRAVMDGPVGRDFLEHHAPSGLVALGWGENGTRHLTNSRHAVHGPADLHGLKIRVPQSDVMVAGFKALGADAQPLGFPALYAALQSQAFDGEENPIATIVGARFDRVQHYLSMTGHVYSPALFLLAADTHAELDGGARDALAAATQAGIAASRQTADEAERTGLATLRQNGMEVVESVDRAAFIAALAPLNEQFAQRFGAERLAAIRATSAGTTPPGAKP